MSYHNRMQVDHVNKIRVVNDRYAIVLDTDGLYRVVSLVRMPARELQPTDTQSGTSYSFDSVGNGYKTNFGQRSLKSMGADRGKSPTELQLQCLTKRGVVTVINDQKVASAEPDGLNGIPTPINNRLLDSGIGGWIIGNVTTQGLDFSSHPKVHHSRAEAVSELGRLAKEFAGIEFVLFKADMTAVANSVHTKTFQ